MANLGSLLAKTNQKNCEKELENNEKVVSALIRVYNDPDAALMDRNNPLMCQQISSHNGNTISEKYISQRYSLSDIESLKNDRNQGGDNGSSHVFPSGASAESGLSYSDYNKSAVDIFRRPCNLRRKL
jgi:hypothetical protein